MSVGNVCAHCGKDLVTIDEIHVVEGRHFCSKECAIISCTTDIITNAKELAIEWYDDAVEIVTPTDIGICYNKVWTSYSKDTDVTTIFLSKCLDKECMEVKTVEVIGFYFGEPNDTDTETFKGELKAKY